MESQWEEEGHFDDEGTERSNVRALDELEGFYIGRGRTVHITFEDADTFVIDIFDDEDGPGKDEYDDALCFPIVVNIKTGMVHFETADDEGRRLLI